MNINTHNKEYKLEVYNTKIHIRSHNKPIRTIIYTSPHYYMSHTTQYIAQDHITQ